MVRTFLSCPASLEEKYSMIRLSDLLRKNKRVGIELEDIAEAMSQLANIGAVHVLLPRFYPDFIQILTK